MPIKYCSECGEPVERKIPSGDNRPRAVCSACGTIHYVNPKPVVGCVPQWQDQVLLCTRAIEPRYGKWTLPAGFMEIGETLIEGALRETREEALATVEVVDLLAIVDVKQAEQVHVFYRATMLEKAFGAGEESLDAQLFAEADIPWDEIAFPSVRYALECFFSDRASGVSNYHSTSMEWPAKH